MSKPLHFFILFSLSLFAHANSNKLKCYLNHLTEIESSPEKDVVDKFYLKQAKVKDHINYHINFERVEKYFENLASRFPNEISIKRIGTFDGKDLKRLDIIGRGKEKRKKVIISAGTHGNESGGIGTLINTLERILHNPEIRNHYDITVIPYINPGGVSKNTRKTLSNVDVNRVMGKAEKTNIDINRLIKDLLLKALYRKNNNQLTRVDIMQVFDQVTKRKRSFDSSDFKKILSLKKTYLKRVENNKTLEQEDIEKLGLQGKVPEIKLVKIIKDTFKDDSFDLALDLHEAPFRDKFFIIKSTAKDEQLTTHVLSHIPQSELITSSDGKYPGIMYKSNPPNLPPKKEIPQNKSYTLHAPGEVSSDNVGTIKTFYNQEVGVGKFSYTLEAPGQYDLERKIKIYSDIVENYLTEFLKLQNKKP